MKKLVYSTFVCDPEIMLKWLQHYGNLRKFYPEKNYGQLYFPQKKKSRPTSHNGRFRDFETEPETPIGNRKFFFSKFNLLV